MRIRIILRLLFLLATVSGTFFLQCGCAGQTIKKRDASPISGETLSIILETEPPPGSEVSLENAIAESDVIVIAKILDVGSAVVGPPGELAYDSIRLSTRRVLKGDVLANITLVGTANVIDSPVAKREQLISGEEYIVFARRPNLEQFEIIKMIVSIEGNIW